MIRSVVFSPPPPQHFCGQVLREPAGPGRVGEMSDRSVADARALRTPAYTR